MTALVILCSGVPIPYGQDIGMDLTERAFSSVFGNGISVVLSFFLCLFALATLLGWGFYGLRCGQYLFGDVSKKIFPYIHGVVVVVAALLNTETLWLISEIVNGLMCIPNLIVLLALSPELILLTKKCPTIGSGTTIN
jgi:AGCS family alanine or glycine:cation symporter